MGIHVMYEHINTKSYGDIQTKRLRCTSYPRRSKTYRYMYVIYMKCRNEVLIWSKTHRYVIHMNVQSMNKVIH